MSNVIFENLKQMQDEKFEWVNPRVRKGVSRGVVSDLSISLISVGGKNKHDGISFVVRNEKEKEIGTNFEIAIFKNRVFFRPTDVPAISLYKNKNTNYVYGRIGVGAIVQTLKKFVGDYEIKHDEIYELYYIEKKEQV